MPDPVSSINRISQLSASKGTGQSGQTAAVLDNFGQILSDSMHSLQAKEDTANQAIATLAAGEDIELHQVMLAMQEADIAFQLAIQIRNKIVDAYQEVMRMQV